MSWTNLVNLLLSLMLYIYLTARTNYYLLQMYSRFVVCYDKHSWKKICVSVQLTLHVFNTLGVLSETCLFYIFGGEVGKLDVPWVLAVASFIPVKFIYCQSWKMCFGERQHIRHTKLLFGNLKILFFHYISLN